MRELYIKNTKISDLFKSIIYSLFLSLFMVLFKSDDTSLVFIFTMFVWTSVFIFYLHDIKNNIATLCFLLSFFILLLGREFSFSFFGLKKYYIYSNSINNKTYNILTISIIFVLIGSEFCNNIKFNKNRLNLSYGKNLNLVIKIIFYISLIVSLYVYINKVIFIKNVGYVASYSKSNSLNIGYLNYLSEYLNFALCLYLSTFPNKKKIIYIYALYEIVLIASLFTGGRTNFVIGNFVMIIYFVIRHKISGDWIKKRYIYFAFILFPLVMIIFFYYDYLRSDREIDYSKNPIVGFLDQQGGSVNNIKRVIDNENDLRDMSLVSFNKTKNAIFGNLLFRNIFEYKIYEGNSIDTALNGNSLAHRLSYLTYGNGYLSGKGTGSSFLAELYFDFNYLGVMIGSFIYGFLLKKISSIEEKGLLTAVLIFIAYDLVYAPRDSFDSFIYSILSLYNIFGLFMTIILSNIKFVTKRRI